MKTIFLSILVLLLLSCSKPDNCQFKVDECKIVADFDTVTKNFSVKANLKININEALNNELHFKFTRNAKISNIQFMETDNSISPSFKCVYDTIFINIPKQLKNQKQLTLSLNYSLPIDSFTTNGIFRLNHDYKWLPFQYTDISKLNLEIFTPISYSAFASGDCTASSIQGNKTYSSWKSYDIPSSLVIIAPKNAYTDIKRVVEGIPLNFYFINKDTAGVDKIVNEISIAFHNFYRIFGGYKGNRLSLYELPDDVQGALALDRTIMFYRLSMSFPITDSADVSQQIDKSLGNLTQEKFNFPNDIFEMYEDYEQKTGKIPFAAEKIHKMELSYIFAHVTAHQWVGSGFQYAVGSRLNRFMEEGLTEYARWMFIENEYGKDSLNEVIKQTKNILEIYLQRQSNRDLPLSQINDLNGILYLKGPLVFHYVRQHIGDENWKTFLRTLYSKYYGKVIDYEIFKSELSKFDKNGSVIKRMEEMTEMKGILPEK